jgi:hypothetical protein
MNIEEIQQMWETDCQIDDNHLGEQATLTPKLHSKYIKELIQYKLKLTKTKSEYNMLRKTKFRYYRGEMSRDELKEFGWEQWQYNKPLKAEMDEFLSGDSDLSKIEARIEYLETGIYLLESILNQLKSRDWEIKSHIEWKKFLAGM